MADDELDALDRVCAEAMGVAPRKLWIITKDGGRSALFTGDSRPDVEAWLRGCGEIAAREDWRLSFWDRYPRPTRSWEDFGALLEWLGGQGIDVEIGTMGCGAPPWQATMTVPDESGETEDIVQYESGEAPDPRIALARAVKAWRESAK